MGTLKPKVGRDRGKLKTAAGADSQELSLLGCGSWPASSRLWEATGGCSSGSDLVRTVFWMAILAAPSWGDRLFKQEAGK